MRKDLEAQLRRQSMWLRDSLLWILKTKVLEPSHFAERPTALDVGCGPGMTMELFKPFARVQGVDIDPEMVRAAKSRGFDAERADGQKLPYEDDSFDVVYCSFVLMWVKDPLKILEEMTRVSRSWVIAFAEPDYGARLDYPSGLSELTGLVMDGIRAEGGDPLIGRKLRHLFANAGMDADMGVHMGIWDIEKLRQESEDEWRWLEMTVPADMKEELDRLRPAWERALNDGSLFQFNPTFYALGRKKPGSH